MAPFYGSPEKIRSLPLIASIISLIAFLLIFFDITDIQKSFKKWISKRVKTTKLPIYIVIISSIAIIATLLASYQLVPIQWKKFIDVSYLNGENDEYASAKDIAVQLIKEYPEESKIIAAGLKIAREQYLIYQGSKKNISDKTVSQSLKILEDHKINSEFINAFRVYSIAHSYSIQGHYKKARKRYTEFLKNKNYIITQKWRNAARLNIGNTFYSQAKYNKALNMWEKLPPSSRVYYNISAAYFFLDKFDSAKNYATKGLSLLVEEEKEDKKDDTRYSGLVGNKMMALLAQSRFQEAIEIFKKSFDEKQRDPNANALENLAIALLLDYRNQEFITLINCTDLIVEKNKEMLYGLYLLKDDDQNGAIKRFKKVLNHPHDIKISDNDVLAKIEEICEREGLLKIEAIYTLLQRGC